MMTEDLLALVARLDESGQELKARADQAEAELADLESLRKTVSEKVQFLLTQQRRVVATNNALARTIDALSVWATKGIQAMTFSSEVAFIPEPVKEAVANAEDMRLRLLSAAADIGDMRPITGVYFLIRGDAIVYVGQSVDVASRLAAHNADPAKDFSRFAYIPCRRDDLNAVEEFFIKLFQPEHNRRGIAQNPAVPEALKKSVLNRIAAEARKISAPPLPQNDVAA